jgi:hypothetical protein
MAGLKPPKMNIARNKFWFYFYGFPRQLAAEIG